MDIIYGRNTVTEILREGKRKIKKAVIAVEQKNDLSEIIELARKHNITLEYLPRKAVAKLAGDVNHQGAVLVAEKKNIATLDDILEFAASKKEKPFIVILDSVQDPHNLGAVLRTADGAGVHGIILPETNSAHITPVVEKVSSGASEHVLVAIVTNLNIAIERLKEKGVWIYGIEAEGKKDFCEEDLTGAIALVLGSEGEGIRPVVKKNCDVLLRIPMKGKVNSLNVSASAAVVMYETVRQRRGKK